MCIAQGTPVQVTIDEASVVGTLDLSRYSLGQGGLSSKSMIEADVDDLAAVRPRYLRFFVQEYYHLYPDHKTYHWDTFDSSMADIVATGAEPIPAMAFKPRVLYPTIDPRIVDPTSYPEWEELIYQLVTHCLQRGYGIHYWEIGNEGNAGEVGGCPYRFTPQGYVRWYSHTAAAILRADPTAKVGGPALGSFSQNDPIGSALIAAGAAGNVPFDFFSWHGYSNDPSAFSNAINEVRAKLAAHPSLSHVETMITEWNIGLGNNNPEPSFQPAFILETTRNFWQAGLIAAHYYHIRDYFVNEAEFAEFMTPHGAHKMAKNWNTLPMHLGLYSKQGVMRPAYYSFLLLSRLGGPQLDVKTSKGDIHGFAVRTSDSLRAVIWNYGGGTIYNVTLNLPSTASGSLTLSRLNPNTVAMETVRQGQIADLNATPLTISLARYGVCYLEVSAGPHKHPVGSNLKGNN